MKNVFHFLLISLFLSIQTAFAVTLPNDANAEAVLSPTWTTAISTPSSITSIQVVTNAATLPAGTNVHENGTATIVATRSGNTLKLTTAKAYILMPVNSNTLFNNFSGLTSLDLSKFAVSEATQMKSMLQGCTSLTSITTPGYYPSGAKDCDLPAIAGKRWEDANGNIITNLFSVENNQSLTLADAPVGTGTIIVTEGEGYSISLTVGAFTYATNTYTGSVGTTVKISLATEVGYRLNGWTDGSTEHPRTVTISEGTQTYTPDVEATKYPVCVLVASGQSSMGNAFLVGYEDEPCRDIVVNKTCAIKAVPNAHYEFDKWNDNNTDAERVVTVTGSTTYRAYFKVASYWVYSNGEHGSIDGANQKYEYNTTATLTPQPDEGYQFKQWSDGLTNNPRHIVVTQDTTINAIFEPRQYHVTFMADGDVVAEGDYDFGTLITPPATNPIKNCYTFSKWAGLDAQPTVPAHDITFEAEFTQNTYTVTYYLNGTYYDKQDNVLCGETISPLAEPTLDALCENFNGWELNGNPLTASTLMPDHSIDVYGTTSAVPYTLYYDVYEIIDGVESLKESNSIELTSGAIIDITTIEENECHTYSAWQNVPAGNIMPCEETHIKCYRTAKEYDLIYNIKDNGEVVETYHIASTPAQSTIALIAVPTDACYDYTSWQNIPDGNIMPCSSWTITCERTAKTYNVIYRIEGEEDVIVPYQVGDDIELLVINDDECKTFSGWNGNPTTMGCEDIILTGSYTPRTYNVIYRIDGEEDVVAPYQVGADIDLLVINDDECKTFSGWSDTPTTMGCEDIILTGSYTPRTHNVIYRIEGEEDVIAPYQVGEDIDLLVINDDECKTFSGWNDNPTTMGCEDIILTGSYTPRTYHVIYRIDGEEDVIAPYQVGADIDLLVINDDECKTFSGWSDTPTTMGCEDIILTGSYTPRTYNVIYRIDGEEVARHSYQVGADIDLLVINDDECKTFSGWSDTPTTMGCADIILTGSYTPRTYNVIYRIEGEEDVIAPYQVGADIDLLVINDDECKTFSGWNDTPTTMGCEDIILTGSYTPRTYNVIYRIEGEEDVIVPYQVGDDIELLVINDDECKTFSGWSDTPTTMGCEDIILTGSYTPRTYNVIYRIEGEEDVIAPYQVGADIDLLVINDDECKTFSGWNDTPTTMGCEDIILTGSYTPRTYNVIYRIEGEEDVIVPYQVGDDIELLVINDDECKTFSGWNDNPTTMGCEDIILTGSYTPRTYNVIYRIDGEEDVIVPYQVGEDIDLLVINDDECKTFSGWSDTPTTMGCEDIILTGSYTPRTYNVIYRIEGEEDVIVPYQVGDDIELLVINDDECKTFSGWNDNPTTMGCEDIILTGSYTAVSYHLTYKVEGEEIETITLPAGAIITPRAQHTDPSNLCGAYTAWQGEPAQMPCEDVEVNAYWQVDSYKVYYTVDGTPYDSTVVNCGERIPLIDTPEKEGHTFHGWNDVPADTIMPNHNITISGQFDINQYTVCFYVDHLEFYCYTADFGTDVVLPPTNPLKEGFEFISWKDCPATIPANDTTIVYAEWKALQYHLVAIITFEGVDNEIYNQLYYYQDEVVMPTEQVKEGYTFSGWDKTVTTMPAFNDTIRGSYSINTYTIRYWNEDESILFHYDHYTYHTNITPYDGIPTKEGHTFAGWEEEIPAIMPANDIAIHARFTRNQYNLIYKVDGVGYDTIPYYFEDPITLIDEPTKEGYTFSGWNEAPATMPAHDVIVEGTFSINTYNAYYLVDANTFATKNITYGEAVPYIVAPTKIGYLFVEWLNWQENMPANDLTMDAQYRVEEYHLVLILDSEIISDEIHPYGDPITLPTPEKEGYNFSGWNKTIETMPAYNDTIYGSFNIGSFTVSYYADGIYQGQDPYTYGTLIIPREAPEKNGYRFIEWQGLPQTMPAANIDVEAIYAPVNYTLTYMVDGVKVAEESYTFGQEVHMMPCPEKQGHTCNGWSSTLTVMPPYDVIVTAQYTINQYEIHYVLEGETAPVHIESYDYNAPITEWAGDASIQRNGYSFVGWTGVPALMPDSNVTVIGHYSANFYTLTYRYVTGTDLLNRPTYETLREDQVRYNEVIDVPEGPARTGYTFNGWEGLPSDLLMPNQDLTVTGTYSINTYTLTYLIDDTLVFQTKSVEYGARTYTAIINPLPTPPAKEGYEFSGWDNVPETMPANDVVVKGYYIRQQYILTYLVDGSEYGTQTWFYNETVTPLDEPTRTGYTFSGWTDLPQNMPAINSSVHGNFTANRHSITYYADGEPTGLQQTYDYGEAIVPPTYPTKVGYTFLGWENVPATMPDNDTIVDGRFQANDYTLTYKVNDATYQTFTLHYQDTIILIDAPAQTGYTFSGWQNTIKNMPAQDWTIYGTLIGDNFTITYFVDGEKYKTVEVPVDAPVTAIEDPVKTGYTFSGWQGVPAVMPANSVEVNGSFTINQYELTYVIDGLTIHTETYDYNAEITPYVVAREGYIFNGWEGMPQTMPNHDVTVQGSYTIGTYTITYLVDGTFTGITQTYPYGEAIVLPPFPTKDGYTFSGWIVPTTMPANDTTVNGSFNINSYTLTYNVDGVEVYTEQVEYQATISLREKPTKEGYTFIGWENVQSTMPAQDWTIYGHFVGAPLTVTYTVDGEEYTTRTAICGNPIELIPAPNKTGYTFSDWKNVPDVMPEYDITIDGYFTAIDYTATYVVDGETVGTQTYQYGATINYLDAPTRDGYTFNGWAGATTMPANDVTIIGTYSKNTYTVFYVIDGETIAQYAYLYDAPVTNHPATPVKDGYNFSGWTEEPTIMPAHDVTVTGSFNAIAYTITYNSETDELIGTQTVLCGQTFTPQHAAPEKVGYTFAGWAGMPEPMVMPNNDFTVKATYTINSYTITYHVDGTTHKVETYPYSAAVTTLAEPTKEGYTFSGWDKSVTGTMPAANIDVYGNFTINQYTITYNIIEQSGDITLAGTQTLDYGQTITPLVAQPRAGYNFNGWTGLHLAMPAENIVVTGYYTTAQFHIEYKVDNNHHADRYLNFGDAIVLIDEPSKTGHTFSGWSTAYTTMPAQDIVINGYFTINTYTITYKVGSDILETQEYEYGQTIPTFTPARTGYTFLGWNTPIPSTMPDHNIIVEGSFATNRYTITYIINGEETYRTPSYEFGATVPQMTDPEPRTGYTFTGWVGEPSVMPAQSINVYGSFERNTYTITYKVDGQTIDMKEHLYGTAIDNNEVAAPEKAGYTFDRWEGLPINMVAENITVNALYTTNYYTLSYVIDGNNTVYTTTKIYNAPITPRDNPERTGYIFSGWNDEPELMPAHDVIVTGSFTPATFSVTYMIDATLYRIINYDYLSTIVPPTVEDREGFTFNGWNPRLPSTMPAYDMTVTGSYSRNTYHLYYVVDGQIVTDITYLYEDEIQPIEGPAKTGYRFLGWEGFPTTGTMPAQNVYVNAKYEAISYTLTYMLDDEHVYQIDTYYYNNLIILPINPQKDGYRFIGWNNLPSRMPASDLTVTAHFVPITYTLTLKTNDSSKGRTEGSGQYTMGETAIAKALPVTGCEFKQWSDGNTQNPRYITMNSDITLTAQFALRQITVTLEAENGTVYGAGTYLYGQEITLMAIPDEGYRFVGWSDGTTSDIYTITVTHNITLEAIFEEAAISEWDGATVTTTYNAADFEWVIVPQAASYVLTIKQGNTIVERMTFNKYGVLTGTSHTGANHAPARARRHTTITVCSLLSCTTYNYLLEVKDEEGNNIFEDSDYFTTDCRPTTDVETATIPGLTVIGATISADCDFRIYSTTGQDVTALNGELIRGIYIIHAENGYNIKVRVQ